jgi:hypothetical protein
MNISKLVVLTLVSVLSLAACERKESLAETQKDVAEAAREGVKDINEARQDVAQSAAAGSEDVAEAKDDLALTAAKAAYNVDIERCEGQTGNARDSCKNTAQAALDAAQARVDAHKR